jgi:pimeloyl-ACP methyl ester carboxylesterase
MAAVVAGALGVSLVVLPFAPAAPAAAAPSGIPQPFVGPDPVGGGSSLDTIARLDGVALLDRLVRLSSSERLEFLDRHPDAVGELAAAPPAASEVTTWWTRTSPTARAALSKDLPGVVGNLEGVPYAVRDVANRTFLSQTVFAIRAQLDAGVGRAMEDELQVRLKMLGAVERSLLTGASGERRYLVALDVTGQGRAVISVGDLTDADYVSFFVPGMYVGVADQLVDWTAWADNSLTVQEDWLDRFGTPGEVATVAWIGYHTPTVVNIAGMDLAYQGRDALTASLDGLHAIRDPAGIVAQGTPDPSVVAERSGPYVTIVAHSYGSTAAMLALQQNDVSVDALVVVGSPGSPATSVDDLKVAGGNVWVAAADSDPVPRSGVFGSQPLDPEFGAHRFSVKAMTDPITGEKLDDISGHVYYFWPGTTSVRNTALIAIGHGELASTDEAPAKAAAR